MSLHAHVRPDVAAEHVTRLHEGAPRPATGAVLARTTSLGLDDDGVGVRRAGPSLGGLAVEPVGQGAHGLGSEALGVLAHRRQGHVRVAGLGDVVEADDGHVTGHAEPGLPHHVDEADRAPVVERRHGRGPFARAEREVGAGRLGSLEAR